jgi:hypothetical protein
MGFPISRAAQHSALLAEVREEFSLTVYNVRVWPEEIRVWAEINLNEMGYLSIL